MYKKTKKYENNNQHDEQNILMYIERNYLSMQ